MSGKDILRKKQESVALYNSHHKFINEINTEIARGFSFVPFIGSGLSKNSGILTGGEFSLYLSHVVREMLKGHEILVDGWPAFPKERKKEKIKKWVEEQYIDFFETVRGHRFYDLNFFSYKEQLKEIDFLSEKIRDESEIEIQLTKNRNSRFRIFLKRYYEEELKERKRFNITNSPKLLLCPAILWDDYKDSLAAHDELVMQLGDQVDDPDLNQTDDTHDISYWERLKETNSSVNFRDLRHSLESLEQEILRQYTDESQSNTRNTISANLSIMKKVIDAKEAELFKSKQSYTSNNRNAIQNQAIIENALKALFDWRATIRFIARAKFNEDESQLLFEEAADQTIIDSFINFLVNGKKPNLAHNMLAHLTSPLRTKLSLTTNFDDLLEQSLRQIWYPFSVLAIGNNSELPAAEVVSAENTVLKLHGGKINTRADFTLDATPGIKDKRIFSSYLSFKDRAHSHLLVMGFSGKDRRIIELINHSLRQLPMLKVFWLYHMESEKFDLISKFKDSSDNGRVKFLHCKRQDLFLYELYQRLTLSLPAAGFSQELVQDIPPSYHEAIANDEQSADRDLLTQKDIKCIVDYFKVKYQSRKQIEAPPKHLEGKGVFFHPNSMNCTSGSGELVIINSHSGLLLRMYSLFQDLSAARFECQWLELEDFDSPQYLAVKILKTLSIKNGTHQLEHVFFDIKPNEKFDDIFVSRLRILKSAIDIAPHSVFLFLYGRNGPGGSSGWENRYWERKDYELLNDFCQQMRRAGFNIIYMPYSNERLEREDEKNRVIDSKNWLKHPKSKSENGNKEFIVCEQLNRSLTAFEHYLLQEKNGYCPPPTIVDPHHHFESIVPGGFKTKGEKTFEKDLSLIFDKFFKPNDSEFAQKLMLIYASTLFRQSRNPGALMSEAVFPCPFKFNDRAQDNDAYRAKRIVQWFFRDIRSGVFRKQGSIVKKDVSHRILFRKSGGFFWVYRDIRMAVQKILEAQRQLPYSPQNNKNLPLKNPIDYLAQGRSRIHFWIGEYYLRDFFSRGHTTPLIESIYHRISCIKFLKFAKPRSLNLDNEEELAAIFNYRLHLLQSSLLEIIKSLRLGRPSLKFWMHGSHGEQLFSEKRFFSAIDIDVTEEGFCKESLNNWIIITVGADISTKNIRRKVEDALISIPFRLDLTKSIVPNDSERLGPQQSFIDNIKELLDCLKYDLEQVRLSMQQASGDRTNASTSRERPKPKFERPTSFKAAQLNNIHLNTVPYEDWTKVQNEYKNEIKKLFNPNDKRITEYIHRFFHLIFDETPSKNIKKTSNELEQERQEMVRMITEIKQPLALNLTGEYYKLLTLVRYLSGLCYSILVRAKTIKRLDEDGISQLWVKVCVLSWLAQDLLKNIHPDYLTREIPLKFELLTYYGLALSHLGRYYEAHRRFNEASAWLTTDSSSQQRVNRAVLYLRRTEFHIIFAEDILRHLKEIKKDSPRINISVKSDAPDWLKDIRCKNRKKVIVHLSRLYTSKLDDAQTSLEGAEALLSSADRTNSWWAHLLFLKLKLIRMASNNSLVDTKSSKTFSSIVFRKQLSYGSLINDIFVKGWLLCSNDPFRKLRLLDEFTRCAMAYACTDRAAHSSFKKHVRKSYELIGLNEETHLVGLAIKPNKQTEDVFRGQILASFIDNSVPDDFVVIYVENGEKNKDNNTNEYCIQVEQRLVEHCREIFTSSELVT